MKQDASPPPPAGPAEGLRKPPATEEPEFNAERDIPTEDGDEVAKPPPDAAPDDESVAGEEDPGAAFDAARPPPGRGPGG